MSKDGESRNFKPEVTPQDQLAAKAREVRDTDERSFYLPDGVRIIRLGETNDEVYVNVVDTKGNRKLDTYKRAEFDALHDQFGAKHLQVTEAMEGEDDSAVDSPIDEPPKPDDKDVDPYKIPDKISFGDVFAVRSSGERSRILVRGVQGDKAKVVVMGPKGRQEEAVWPTQELMNYLHGQGAKYGGSMPVGEEDFPSPDEALQSPPEITAQEAEVPVIETPETPVVAAEPKPQDTSKPVAPAPIPKIIPVTTPDVVEPIQVEPVQPEPEAEEPKDVVESVAPPEESVVAPMEESFDDIAARLAANLAAKPEAEATKTKEGLSPERIAELQKLAAEGEAAKQKLDASGSAEQAQKDVNTLQGMQRALSDKLSAATSESEKRQIQEQIDALDSAISLKIAKAAGENLSDERKAELERLAAEGVAAKESLLKNKKDITPEREAELKDLAAKGLEAKKELAENSSLSDERKAELQKLIDEGEAAKTELDGSLTGDEKAKKLAAEAEKHREAEFERIDGEMETSVEYAVYQSALNKYAALKADNDTKGIIGRKKRREQLTLAEDDLVNAKKALAFATVKRRKEAELYGEDEAKAKQAESDDLFNEIRKIDPESRARTNEILISRQENRNRFEKAFVAIGRFFNRGNKFTKNAKNAGMGLGLGLALGVSGVGWPVTAAASAGLGVAIRAASRTAYLDETLKTHMDDKGEVIPQFTDEKYNAFLKSITESSAAIKNSSGKMADKLARDILSDSRKVGEEEYKKARGKASWNAGMFAAGMALGGVGGNLIHDAWVNAHAPVVSTTPHPNEGTLPNTRYPDAVPTPTGHIPLDNARFPWNYSANHGGAQNAMNQLQTLADAAKSRGHSVVWYVTKNGSRALRVDGNDTTQYVIDVLWGNN